MMIIELIGVSKIFRGSHGIGQSTVALNHINLAINEGESVAIWGISGAGKTTLLNLMAGIDKPSSGKVMVLGKDLSLVGNQELVELQNKHIGFVFQNYNLLPMMTTLNNTMLPALILGLSLSDAKQKAIVLLGQVGLGNKAHIRAGQLSGGEAQRATLARALINNPRIMLADEPTGNLDAQTAKQIVELFQEVQKDRTVIFATHDPAIKQICQRTIVLEGGRITDQKKP